jgi:tripartite-type tricarboxylate transporter receptor subunit TctC
MICHEIAMKLHRRRLLQLAAGAAALPALARRARAQAYPSRPITIVVPLPPGGAYDLLARLLAEPMRASLGQPVLVENIPGADRGIIKVVRAAPDGYTLGIGGWNTYVLRPAVFPMQHDLLKELEPIAFLADSPYWIISKDAVPAKNLAELIAWLKENHGKATAGMIAGGGSHVCGAYLQNSTGTTFQLVPYRGGAPALQDLVAGQIDFMCDFAANSLEQFRSGKVRAYAVMAKHRWYAAPEIPTADEAGLPGFYISNWSGLWAPAGTPQDIIGKLNAAIVAALADATIRKRYLDLGQEMPPAAQQTPQALRDLHKAEVEKWFPIVEAAGIRG